MAIQPVRPGDLISAQGFNDLVAKIDELEQRIAALEEGDSTGTVDVTSFEPTNQIAVGQELSVLGVGFQVPGEANEVTVDGVPVPQLNFRLGSTSTRIRFIVPPLSGIIPSIGRPVLVRVTNNNGTDSLGYRILPPLPTNGEPPVINAITPASGNFLRIGEEAVISGANFSTNPADNHILFRDVAANQTFPPDGQTVEILSAAEGEIHMIIPEISTVPAPGGGGRPIRVELTIGAHPAAVRNVNIRRPN